MQCLVAALCGKKIIIDERANVSAKFHNFLHSIYPQFEGAHQLHAGEHLNKDHPHVSIKDTWFCPILCNITSAILNKCTKHARKSRSPELCCISLEKKPVIIE